MRNEPMIGFSGDSGSGKTSLIRRLVALDAARGFRVGFIKHTHHEAVTHGEGDSASLLPAGALESIVAGPWGAMRESDASRHVWQTIDDLIRLLPDVDRTYVEGFRNLEDLPRIHVIRGHDSRGLPAGTLAIVGDAPNGDLPTFSFSDLAGIAAFLDTIAPLQCASRL